MWFQSFFYLCILPTIILRIVAAYCPSSQSHHCIKDTCGTELKFLCPGPDYFILPYQTLTERTLPFPDPHNPGGHFLRQSVPDRLVPVINMSRFDMASHTISSTCLLLIYRAHTAFPGSFPKGGFLIKGE